MKLLQSLVPAIRNNNKCFQYAKQFDKKGQDISELEIKGTTFRGKENED